MLTVTLLLQPEEVVEQTERLRLAREQQSEHDVVNKYLKRVGLEAWIPHLEKHLPANCKSVALVRGTT
eukprot:COSAG06_NODE_54260_length_295_cov_1.229592_1_plen_67_part_10